MPKFRDFRIWDGEEIRIFGQNIYPWATTRDGGKKIGSPVEHIILGQNRSQNAQTFTRFARGGAGRGSCYSYRKWWRPYVSRPTREIPPTILHHPFS